MDVQVILLPWVRWACENPGQRNAAPVCLYRQRGHRGAEPSDITFSAAEANGQAVAFTGGSATSALTGEPDRGNSGRFQAVVLFHAQSWE
jgi:hypothetical protein